MIQLASMDWMAFDGTRGLAGPYTICLFPIVRMFTNDSEGYISILQNLAIPGQSPRSYRAKYFKLELTHAGQSKKI